jgi:hypothetical protein
VNALHDFYALMHEFDACLPATLGDTTAVKPTGSRRATGRRQLGLFDNPGEPPLLDEPGDDVPCD